MSSQSVTFREIAVQNRIVSTEQIEECLALQAERAREGLRMALGVILLEKGYMNQQQLEQVLSIQAYVEARREDVILSQIIAKNGFVEKGRLDPILAEQERTFRTKLRIIRLMDLLSERGLITERQVELTRAAHERIKARQSGAVPVSAPPTPGPDKTTFEKVKEIVRKQKESGRSGQARDGVAKKKNRDYESDYAKVVQAIHGLGVPSGGKGRGQAAEYERMLETAIQRPSSIDLAPVIPEARCDIQVRPFSGNRELLPEDRPVTVVRVSGSLDSYTFPRFDETLARLADEGKVRLVISFEGLDYISSAGLGVLVEKTQALAQKGGGLRLSSVPDKIQRVLDILGSEVVAIHPTEQQAALTFV
ncbi:MAG: STAS domain-containing protein [Planctomycetes bacterium]|nr:STAS domain-containing protein [Planctomycetota bacterium]